MLIEFIVLCKLASHPILYSSSRDTNGLEREGKGLFPLLNSQSLGGMEVILKEWFSNALDRSMPWAFLMKLLGGEFRRTPLIASQHWIRWWLGAVRQQAITWFIVDPDLYPHMASLGHCEISNGDTTVLCNGIVINTEVLAELFCICAQYVIDVLGPGLPCLTNAFCWCGIMITNWELRCSYMVIHWPLVMQECNKISSML